MDEKVREIQTRLRKTMSTTLLLDDSMQKIPIVGFEEVSVKPPGTERFVLEVITELKERGYRVAAVKRLNINTASEQVNTLALPYMEAGSDAALLSLPNRMITVRKTESEPSLKEMVEALGEDFDVIIGESFGYYAVPKFLITKRPQEGFNLGLPNIIGYVSERDANATIPWFKTTDISAVAEKIERDIIGKHKADYSI